VLSFPLEEMPHLPLGSIVISIDRAKEVSSRLSHDCDDEVALLFIHGLLHLLGYDHESDEGQMREKEASLIKEFDLPNSLILRND
jgi:probable rRNA maturation factor